MDFYQPSSVQTLSGSNWSPIQNHAPDSSSISYSDDNRLQENQYSTQYDNGYMDLYDYSCQYVQTQQIYAYSEQMKEQRMHSPNEKYLDQKHQANHQHISENSFSKPNQEILNIQNLHQNLILHLQAFSETSFIINDIPFPFQLIKLRSYLEKISLIVTKIFTNTQSVNAILKKPHSKQEKGMLEEIIFENITWFVWMVTKYERWDLQHDEFYKLFNEIYSKFNQSARVMDKINEWKNFYLNRFLARKDLTIKLIEQENKPQNPQNHQDEFQENDILVKTYFNQKIEANINYQQCFKGQGKTFDLAKYLETMVNMKSNYHEMSQIHLKSIHKQVNNLGQDELFQLVLNYFQAQTSQLVIEHTFCFYIQKYQGHSNSVSNQSRLDMHIEKFQNHLNSKILAWTRKNLLQLIKIQVKSTKSSLQSDLLMETSLVQEFLTFWSDKKQCGICQNAYQSYEIMTAFDCNHEFCHHCLTQHVNHKLQQFTLAKCPMEECQNLMNKDSHFYRLMPIQNLNKDEKISHYLYIQNDQFLKLCPTQKCNGLILLIQGEQITCYICKKVFCENCFMPIHEGHCEHRKVEYLKKNYGYSQCSNCLFLLEKSKGCNHMTCICGYEFCYRCGMKWHAEKNCKEVKKEQQKRLHQIQRYELGLKQKRQEKRQYMMQQQVQRGNLRLNSLILYDRQGQLGYRQSQRIEEEELELAQQISEITLIEQVQEQSFLQHEEQILIKMESSQVHQDEMMEIKKFE